MERNAGGGAIPLDTGCDRSTDRLNASVGNLDAFEDRNADTEDKTTQKRNRAIIQRILKMFDLEETILKYETKDVMEFVLDPNDFGYDCSLSTTRVRQRLCDLMGTDVIRLNDRRYFKKLSERLQEEYDTSMDKQEGVRAASEDARQRRLMMDGYVKSSSDYRAVIYTDHKKKSRKKVKRKGKKQSSDKDDEECLDETNSGHPSSRSNNSDDIETQIQKMGGTRSKSGSSTGSRAQATQNGGTSCDRQRRKSGKSDSSSGESQRDIKYSRPPHHGGAYGGTSSTSTSKTRAKSAVACYSHWNTDDIRHEGDEESTKGADTMSLNGDRKKQTKYSKQEGPLVNDLRREQTVAGLYSIAEELISPIKTTDAIKPKKY